MASALSKKRDRVAWEARAIALADEHHAIGTARWIGENGTAQLYRVPSETSDAVYVVSVYPLINDAVCCCTAGTYGRPCKHLGAALHGERQRTEKSSGPDMNTWAFLNNCP